MTWCGVAYIKGHKNRVTSHVKSANCKGAVPSEQPGPDPGSHGPLSNGIIVDRKMPHLVSIVHTNNVAIDGFCSVFCVLQ